jgi:hypothetical protein
VEYFNYLDSITRNDARCTSEIIYRIPMAKAESNKNKALFTSKLDIYLRMKLVNCYTGSTAVWC